MVGSLAFLQQSTGKNVDTIAYASRGSKGRKERGREYLCFPKQCSSCEQTVGRQTLKSC